jgi:hypothetical protein
MGPGPEHPGLKSETWATQSIFVGKQDCTGHSVINQVSSEVLGVAIYAILTRERRPGRGTLLTILLAISSEAVAAGDGALQT